MRESKISAFALMTLLSLSALSAGAPSPASHVPEADKLDERVRELLNAGQYSEALPLAIQSLDIREKVDPKDLSTTGSLNNLATLYEKMSNPAKAEPLFLRAIKIDEKALGPEHPETATSLCNLAEFYLQTESYDKAEPLYQRALKIREKVLGPDHPDIARTLNSMAALYRKMSDYAKADSLLQRALKIDETTLGMEHPDTANILSNLSRLYEEMGDYAKAETFCQRAIEIDEKTLGTEHPDTATMLNLLGYFFLQTADYAKAKPLFQRVLKIREKVLGAEHPDTATPLDHLARIYRSTGDYAKAESFAQRALNIQRKTLGPENPRISQSLSDLAFLNYDKAFGPKGVPTTFRQQAFRLAEQARRLQEKTFLNVLSFTSEQQRLAFQKTTRPYDLPATLQRVPELAETVLRQKGVVLDSLLEDRLVAEASEDPKQHAAVNELRSAKQRLMQLQLETPKDLSEEALEKRDAERKKLSDSVEELEAGLAKQVAGLGRVRRAFSVSVSQVQSALSKDETLVELLRYSYYRGGQFAARRVVELHVDPRKYVKPVSHYLPDTRFEARYGAIVIAPDGEPEWVPLGSAIEIEKNVALYQKSARGETDETALSGVLRALHTQVWAPIAEVLRPDTKTVIISPDSELSFVSFATLIGPDDKFVAEKYSVRYVASGRDLLREFKTGNNSQASVYANPDFGSKASPPDAGKSVTVALRSIEMRDLQTISLPQLPGTETEAAALQKKFGTSAKVFLGANATKAQLQLVDSPRILHLATHGFFLPEIELGKTVGSEQADEEIPKAKLVNPMHRSGLALAGAQTTLQAWGRGEVPPRENDGVVTAEDVGGLKLTGTWLVVLSACETGSGEARAGEGVMGLRRGFIQAGAQNLLMTLWPISDQTTVQIMLDFYDAADKTHNAPQALADVQRDWLVKLRKERGLLDAVRLAGPFIMSSQGKL